MIQHLSSGSFRENYLKRGIICELLNTLDAVKMLHFLHYINSRLILTLSEGQGSHLAVLWVRLKPLSSPSPVKCSTIRLLRGHAERGKNQTTRVRIAPHAEQIVVDQRLGFQSYFREKVRDLCVGL